MNNPESLPSESENKAEKQSAADDFLIAGIGASAGGVAALKEFFENVPADSGVAYVVILHLSPDHDSQLAEVLQVAAPIPVTQVTEKVRIVPNHVYVVPPNRSLSMSDGEIIVLPVVSVEERRAPVDIFLRTLAESHRDRAVAVILSGTGANGSMGIKRVKEKGGAAFVQNPREAEYSDMPRHSIATDLIDTILPVARIPAQIIAYKNNRGSIEIPIEPEKRSDDLQQSLREIFTQLRIRTGHDFSNYKRATVLRRIERRINVRNLPDLPTYTQYLRENPDEAQALLKDLLISVTNFFRDQDAYTALEKEILPRIIKGRKAGDQVRVWVAGCATGEEAYSLAILLSEQTRNVLDAPALQIFATDIDEDAIAAAREGLYTLNDAADVSPERLHRFFTREGDHYRVRRELREMVLFANHNLIKDPPFARLDLVTCRNLLIYFNQAAQERVMETFHFALNPAAFLFIGSSESVDGASDLFAPVSRENHIYQSRQINSRVAYPVPSVFPTLNRPARARPNIPTREQESRVLARISYGDLHQQLLEQYAAPSVVVNEEYDILHLSERAGRYMQVAGGEASLNLLKVVRQELRLELRTALYQAVQRRTNVEVKNLPVQIDGQPEIINIYVRPVLRSEDTARGFLLVLFEPNAELSESAKPIYSSPEPVARQLEEELTRLKTHLRGVTEQFETQAEELKASNEELQAMNEELRSSAEELETSKEELQSVNEELVTVNQELKIKVEELAESNSDFQNLINSNDIGTIFLDRSLRVNLFSPAARDIFNLIPADFGRSLSDITNRLEAVDLTADAETVLKKLIIVEREARTIDGEWFLLRFSPYRTEENRINGVVLSFINITSRKHSETALIEMHARLANQAQVFSKTLSTITDFAYTFDRDGRFIYSNAPLLKLLGITLEEIIGKNFFDLNYPTDLAARLQQQIQHVFETGETVRGETPFTSAEGAEGFYEYILSPFVGADGSIESVAGSTRDVTERRNAEEALRLSEERLRLIVESVTEYGIVTVDLAGIVTGWNYGAEKIFGYTKSQIIGKPLQILSTPEDIDRKLIEQEMVVALETGRAENENWHVRQDGSRFFASCVLSPLKNGHIEGFVKIARDLTEKAAVEKVLRDRENLKQMVGAQEDERRRLARDLHDHLGQQLTALRMKLEHLKEICNDEVLCETVEDTQNIARKIDSDVGFLAWEMRPAALDDLGLVAAVEKYLKEWTKQSGIAVDFHTSGLKNLRFAPETETNLYRIAQEALNNIYKHASAETVNVLLELRTGVIKGGGIIVLIIEDDGIGFDVEDKLKSARGIGLIGMQERAALIGGTHEIESTPGAGTTVFARVPVQFSDEILRNG